MYNRVLNMFQNTSLEHLSLFACKSATEPAFDMENAKKEIAAANVALTELIANYPYNFRYLG